MKRDWAIIILAAGKGTRMEADIPKVLCRLGNRPLLYWVLRLASKLKPEKIIVVAGYKFNLIKEYLSRISYKIHLIKQGKLLGTAHSLAIGLQKVPNGCSQVLVLFGDDSALYSPSTIQRFMTTHEKSGNLATLMTYIDDKISDIGGLHRDEEGNLVGIYTLSQLKKEKIKKSEILCGAFCFNKDWIKRNLKKIKKSAISGEYPLPSIIGIAAEEGEYLKTFVLDDKNEWQSVNTPSDLRIAEIKLRTKKHG